MSEDDLIEGLKAMAHPLRFRILAALGSGERNVRDIEKATGIGQPGLSQQLSVLRKAGLVDTRKHAKLVFYGIAQGRIAAINTAIRALSSDNAIRDARSDRPAIPAPGVANFARMS